MHFPLTPHHVQLVAACYPPSAALLTSAPDYKPNSQELSRLTYYASNRPGKITKLSNELQKRVVADSRKARSGNQRARASLLISLNILKTLTTECRRDITLLSTALMSALDSSLAALPNDLEIAAKIATVFTAWTTFSNGQLLGIDQALTRDYVANLRRFSGMCLVDVRKGDYEDRNRTRLIGLGALTGAVASEALYNSSSHFKSQAFTIVPALLMNLFQTDISVLISEAENNKNHPLPLNSYLSDFRSRPLLERRAASIHVHVDGDKGPSTEDVVCVALRAFECLVTQSNGTQLGHVLQAAFDSLGSHNGWKDMEHCCWLAQKVVEWAQYQYRFAVPTRLVERLLEAQDDQLPSELHLSLLAMIKTVFTSSTPVVNLSTSDVCSNLTSLMLRRVTINPHDELLPKLVDCIGALVTHIYYADQIHDLACEIIGRLNIIESNGIAGRGRSTIGKDEERAMGLRCLIAALEGLIQTCNRPLHSSVTTDGNLGEKPGGIGTAIAVIPDGDHVLSPKQQEDAVAARAILPHRIRIPPDVWQETLTLLCDEDFAVRSDYARLLVLYLRTEICPGLELDVKKAVTDKEVALSARASGEAPFNRAFSAKKSTIVDTTIIRFLNAMQATLYVLATSPHLGLLPSSPPSPGHSSEGGHEPERGPVHVNIIPSTPLHDEPFTSAREETGADASHTSQSSRRKSTTLSTHSRKFTKIRRLLEAVSERQQMSLSDAEGHSTCLSDYQHISVVLTAVHEVPSSSTLLTGLPMLLALNSCSKTDSSLRREDAGIRQVLARQMQVIADTWDCTELQSAIDDAHSTLGSLFSGSSPEISFPQSEETVPLAPPPAEGSGCELFDTEMMIMAFAKNGKVQRVTGLDESNLRMRLGMPWTAENALRDSVEQLINGDSHGGHINPVLKISSALMHISNLSLQSLTRSNRGVGVNDLRDVLEGRSGMSNLALAQGKAPSVSSLGAPTYSASGDSVVNNQANVRMNRLKPRTVNINGESPKEVRDVLDKLGIGAKNGANLLKASLSTRQKSTRSVLIPPYKG